MVGTRLSQRSERKVSSDSSEDSFVDPEPQLCNICQKSLDEDDEEGEHIRSIECEQCGKWSHNACSNVTPEIFELLNQHNFRWYCPPCQNKSLNLSNIFVFYQHLQLQHGELLKEVADLKSRLDAKDKADKETVSDTSVENSHFPSLLSANTPKDTTQIEKFLDDHVKPAISSAVSKSNEVSTLLSDMIEEKEQINKIKLNLVVSGVEESTSPEEDIVKITDILTKEMNVTPQIEKVERCGKLRHDEGSESKPRLLKLFMKNARNRKELLQKAKELRNSSNEYVKNNIYLRPDQTLKQQKDSKNLRDRLRQLRSDNPDKIYFIKRGVIEELERNKD